MNESPYATPTASVDPPSDDGQLQLARPKEVTVAIWLMFLPYLPNWALELLSWDNQTRLEATRYFFSSQALGIGVMVWIAFKIYQGRNWARILNLILDVAGLALVLALSFSEVIMVDMTIPQTITSLFNVAASVFVIWLLFFSKGKHWFEPRGRGAG